MLAFRTPVPQPPSVIIEVGDGLRARIPLLQLGSSDVDPVLRLSLGLSGISLPRLEGLSGVLKVGIVPGSAPGSTGTPLRAMEGLRGGSSLILLLPPLPPFSSMFLLAMRGLSGGCSERGCCWSGDPWIMWTMGSRGGWKALVGWESCLEGLDVRGQSARLVCSLKGLAGLSWSTVVVLVLGLEGDGEGQVGNLGVSLGLLGTMFLLLRDSLEDRRCCRGLSEPSWPTPLRLGFGLGGASVKTFLCSLGLSRTFWPTPALLKLGRMVRGWGTGGGWVVKL